MTAEKRRLRIAFAVYGVYLFLLFIAVVLAKADHLMIRQYLRSSCAFFAVAGGIVVMILWNKNIPAEKKKTRIITGIITVLFILVSCGVLFVHAFFGTDKESVALIDGQKKIMVETSFLMIYDVSYYDYGNAFWYKEFPCVRESYDDGNPDDLVYTDYYDERGVLVERVFAEE